MVHLKRQAENQTTFGPNVTSGLGELQFLHPPGTFALTPASLISLEAIFRHQALLSGTGIDWGCGTGCLAIAAARVAAVEEVIGLELSGVNVRTARENARRNGVADKVTILGSDSFTPFAPQDRATLARSERRVNFLLANPPSSEGDDGFGYRRRVLREGAKYLAASGRVFLSISSQYGRGRIERLTAEVTGFVDRGLLASTDWVPFDLARPDLLDCLELYAQEESRGGLEYSFGDPTASESKTITAQAALGLFEQTGQSPLSKWQTHLFEFSR